MGGKNGKFVKTIYQGERTENIGISRDHSDSNFFDRCSFPPSSHHHHHRFQHPLVQRSQRRLQNIVCPEHPLIVPETRVPSQNCLSPVFRPRNAKISPNPCAIITARVADIKPTRSMNDYETIEINNNPFFYFISFE